MSVIILYSTRSRSTEKMANAIAEGASEKGVEVKVYSLRRYTFEDVVGDLERAKAIVIGSPTHNYKPAYEVEILLSKLEGLNVKGKLGAAFGSYGWSGEGAYEVQSKMKRLGFNMVSEPLTVVEEPNQEHLEKCRELGRVIAEKVAGS